MCRGPGTVNVVRKTTYGVQMVCELPSRERLDLDNHCRFLVLGWEVGEGGSQHQPNAGWQDMEPIAGNVHRLRWWKPLDV